MAIQTEITSENYFINHLTGQLHRFMNIQTDNTMFSFYVIKEPLKNININIQNNFFFILDQNT